VLYEGIGWALERVPHERIIIVFQSYAAMHYP
jgi:hypothetical protein